MEEDFFTRTYPGDQLLFGEEHGLSHMGQAFLMLLICGFLSDAFIRRDARDRERLHRNIIRLFLGSAVTFPVVSHLAYRGWSGLIETESR